MLVSELVDRLVVLLIVLKTHGEVSECLLARSIAIVYPIIQVNLQREGGKASMD